MKNKLKDIAMKILIGLVAAVAFLLFVVALLFLMWQGGLWLEGHFGHNAKTVVSYYV